MLTRAGGVHAAAQPSPAYPRIVCLLVPFGQYPISTRSYLVTPPATSAGPAVGRKDQGMLGMVPALLSCSCDFSRDQ